MEKTKIEERAALDARNWKRRTDGASPSARVVKNHYGMSRDQGHLGAVAADESNKAYLAYAVAFGHELRRLRPAKATHRVVIELEIEGLASAAELAVNAILDDGTLQDAINERLGVCVASAVVRSVAPVAGTGTGYPGDGVTEYNCEGPHCDRGTCIPGVDGAVRLPSGVILCRTCAKTDGAA